MRQAMNCRAFVAIVLLATLVLAAAAYAHVPVRGGSYAAAQGCRYQHPSREAYRHTTRLLRNERVVGAPVKRRVHKWAVCVATRAKAHAVHEHVRRLWAWRHSYAHVWPIRLSREDAGWRAWAWSTSGCESGHRQSAVSDNGLYFSFFQWAVGVPPSPNTWGAAGGYGSPLRASYAHQAVLAIRFARRYGRQHWPVCG